MIEPLCTDEDLQRRLDARRAMEGERGRVRCAWCKKPIPETRQKTARYCSKKCHGLGSTHTRNQLRSEIRQALRAIVRPKDCPGCGEAMPPDTGHSRVSKRCRRCALREARRRYYHRHKLCSRQAAADVSEQLGGTGDG